MRGKEEAHDYRYFPDPDLLPLFVDEDWIERAGSELPELPEAKKQRFMEELGLSSYDAEVLTASRDLAGYFEECLKKFNNPKQVANWVMGPLLGLLNAQGKEIRQSPVSSSYLADLLKLMDDGVISGKIAKTVFEDMAKTGKAPKEIVEEKGLIQMNDASEIEKIVDDVIAKHPGQVEQFKSGKTKLLGFFVGQVMKETKGKANPKIVNELFRDKLNA